MDLKPISVFVCVRALEAAGFVVKQSVEGFTVLRDDEHVVVVPSMGSLDAEMQLAILRSANLDEARFRRLIASQSGMFTKPDTVLFARTTGGARK